METITEDSQQRYVLWKKNAKLLYDYLNTNNLKWPSLSCQFFPDLDTCSDTYRLLLTSFTSSQLPQEENVIIASLSTLRHVPWSSLNNFDMDDMEFKPDTSTKLPPKNLQSQLAINFPNGDCNRATYLPQNPDLISAASSDGSVYIFDRTKRGKTSLSQLRGPFEIQLLPENSISSSLGETLALDWNLQKEGILASSYSGGQLCIWDIKKFQKKNPRMTKPDSVLTDTTSKGFNDISWMFSHDCLLSIAREDNIMSLFDTRAGTIVSQTLPSNHSHGINCTRFNPKQDLLVATACTGGLLHLWDIRKLDAPIKIINCDSAVSVLEWNPQVPTVLATGGQEDGTVKLLNTSNGQLLFTHGGHMLGVNDLAWSSHDKWLICSVANDNSAHVWKPASRLVT